MIGGIWPFLGTLTLSQRDTLYLARQMNLRKPKCLAEDELHGYLTMEQRDALDTLDEIVGQRNAQPEGA